MSKRKSSNDASRDLPFIELDQEQVAALERVPDSLHPNLKCLVPVLDAIRKAYTDEVAPHRRVLPVTTAISYDHAVILTF